MPTENSHKFSLKSTAPSSPAQSLEGEGRNERHTGENESTEIVAPVIA